MHYASGSSARIFHIFIAFSILVFFNIAGAQEAKQIAIKNNKHTIKLYNAGWTPNIREYQHIVLKELFDSTIDAYGPYEIVYNKEIISGDRLIYEIIKGEKMHLSISTGVSNEKRAQADITQIRIPLFNRVLGLRKLLIEKTQESHFTRINSIPSFKEKRAGLVIGWTDSDILKEGGVTVKDAIRYDNLYPMLLNKRFDYIPLGLIEIETSLQAKPGYQYKIGIHEDIYIFYSIPTYFNVSNSHQKLQKRIRLGLKKMSQTNFFEMVFMDFFADKINKIEREQAKVFVFKNHRMTDKDNKKDIDAAINSYFSKESKIFYIN